MKCTRTAGCRAACTGDASSAPAVVAADAMEQVIDVQHERVAPGQMVIVRGLFQILQRVGPDGKTDRLALPRSPAGRARPRRSA